MVETRYVLGISDDNRQFLVGTTEDFVPHLDFESGSGLFPNVELFDDLGRPLTIRDDDSGAPALALVEGVDPIEDHVLVGRIGAALAHAQVVLDAAGDGDVVGPIPLLKGDLRVVLAALAAFFGPLPPAGGAIPPNRGTARHNWQHEKGCAVH